jgi:hypothetical protein
VTDWPWMGAGAAAAAAAAPVRSGCFPDSVAGGPDPAAPTFGDNTTSTSKPTFGPHTCTGASRQPTDILSADLNQPIVMR